MASGWQNIIYGMIQNKQAKDAAAKLGERPQYEIPQAYKDMMTDAQLMAAEGLPAAQKQQFVENIARSQGAALQGISQRKGGLEGVADVYQTTADANRDMLSMDAQARFANRKNLQVVRDEYGGQQAKQWYVNKFAPWMQEDQRIKALKGAAEKNIVEGAGAEMQSVKSFFENFYGGGGNNAPNPTAENASNSDYPQQNPAGQEQQPDYSEPGMGGFGGGGFAYSDIRLKTNISLIGRSPSGINIYTFAYKNNPSVLFKGVMAQNVPQASILMDNGFYAVNYDMIDVTFERI